jgi:hypothetical protein
MWIVMMTVLIDHKWCFSIYAAVFIDWLKYDTLGLSY